MSGAALLADAAAPARSATARCVHCGEPGAGPGGFCCAGCEGAHALIHDLGLGRYYEQRVLAGQAAPPRPVPALDLDFARHVTTAADGTHSLTMAVEGLQCGACVWLIESVLAREPEVTRARVNMTTRRLALAWRGEPGRAAALVDRVARLGYRLVPFDPTCLAAAQDRTGRDLLRALAVAGFAAANVMLPSVAIWAGLVQDMGPATRSLLHWVSALIAMPAIAYAGRPFFHSAFAALRAGHTNMDVPISIGVILVTGMSLAQTMAGGEHAYFDSAVSLLFFLLIGRLLDHRARAQARATAEQLLALQRSDVAVIGADGRLSRVDQQAVPVGARVLVGMGERIGVDGLIESGAGQLDTTLVTGESLPVAAGPGTRVFAGTLNLGAPITVRTTAAGGGTLLAECVRLMDAAEARRGRFVLFADRVARRYAPTVHLAALLTFLWWWGVAGAGAGEALLIACAVLIITCPCALALAVPAVQVIVTGALFRRGILLKSPTALERLAEVDTVVFDKTGTLTRPSLAVAELATVDREALRLAATLAATSRHPLARALVEAAGPVSPAEGVREVPGAGLAWQDVRLGSAAFLGRDDAATSPCLWLRRPGHADLRFGFAEAVRDDAAAIVARLRAMGMEVRLLSGDGDAPVRAVAERLGLATWRAGCSPVDKVSDIEALRAAGRRVLMVGDGLNDGPALAAALVSMSPSTAADVSQNAADVVFQGALLAPVADTLRLARRARAVTRQNIGLSLAYNLLMVPLAVAGMVTPWLAAAAMSSSSLLVMGNSFRARGGTP